MIKYYKLLIIINDYYRPQEVKYEEDTEPAAREKVAVPNDWQWSNTQNLIFILM